MTYTTRQIYVIDDDAASRDEVSVLVRPLGTKLQEFDSVEAFLEAYDGYRPACIVADMRMFGEPDDNLLLKLRRRDLTIPVVFLTAHADIPATVLAMQSGAFSTIDKSCENTKQWDTISDALLEDERRGEEDRLRQDIRRKLGLLTQRQHEVLKLLLAGVPNKQIADKLKIAVRTVETRRRSLLKKLEVESIAELVRLVILAEPQLLPPAQGKECSTDVDRAGV